ncbi:MAG: hypothetical protein PHC62_07140 [Candidatus Izemoplasmatales bacterium]|nr:hypothetical protein [Candidatus Izemoplasmatales bacterium]
MITKWKVIDPIKNNTTTFRFWCENETTDLELAEYLIGKYILGFGYETNGLIKIKMEDEIYYEIMTTLPFSLFQKNNDFNDFVAVSNKKIKGIKK